MVNDFESYIKQLQDLENAENVAQLKAIREMNENVLSFFPLIWESINKLISSRSISQDTINEIKKSISYLSTCRIIYWELSSCERSQLYSQGIISLLAQKDMIGIIDAEVYERKLQEILDKNAIEVEKEKEINVEKERENSLKKDAPKKEMRICCDFVVNHKYAVSKIDVYLDGKMQKPLIIDAEYGIFESRNGFHRYDLYMSNEGHVVELLPEGVNYKIKILVPKVIVQRKMRVYTIRYELDCKCSHVGLFNSPTNVSNLILTSSYVLNEGSGLFYQIISM